MKFYAFQNIRSFLVVCGKFLVVFGFCRFCICKQTSLRLTADTRLGGLAPDPEPRELKAAEEL